MIYMTSFAGAHRWEVRDQADGAQSNYDWKCSCGDRGHVATYKMSFVMECYVQHAVHAIEEAAAEAIGLTSTWTPEALYDLAQDAKAQGDPDLHNILLRAASAAEGKVE